ncbi:hypothetical protein NQ318_023033, partial [Aromia moschata]
YSICESHLMCLSTTTPRSVKSGKLFEYEEKQRHTVLFLLMITGEHLYSGIAHAASTIFKEEGGIRALYRGFVPTLMGMVPYAGLSFYCFEYLKFGCMKYLPRLTSRPCDKNTGGLVLTVPAKLVCGGWRALPPRALATRWTSPGGACSWP